MKPTPARQRRQTHRQRLALGRALHQVRKVRDGYWKAADFGAANLRRLGLPVRPWQLSVPRIVRKYEGLLRRVLGVLGT